MKIRSLPFYVSLWFLFTAVILKGENTACELNVVLTFILFGQDLVTWGTLHGWAPEVFNLFSFTLSHWCIDKMIMYDQNCSALREALIYWDTFLVRKNCFELLISPEVGVNHQREMYSKALVPYVLPPGICASLVSVWETEMLKR